MSVDLPLLKALSMNSLLDWHFDGETRVQLGQWQSVCTDPDAYLTASTISNASPVWQQGLDPWVAQAISAEKREHYDLWCKTRVSAPSLSNTAQALLAFDGLATISEVWFNGVLILTSQNMFIRHALEITDQLLLDNELIICHRALSPKLEQRKPRPAWRTGFVNHKNLHWFRTSLLGRIPTWSVAPPLIGPWAPVQLVVKPKAWVDDVRVRTEVKGTQGLVHFSVVLSSAGKNQVRHICAKVANISTQLTRNSDNNRYEASLVLGDIQLWWPHTHGEPILYKAKIDVCSEKETITLNTAAFGFRDFEWRDIDKALAPAQHTGLNFGLNVNGCAVFCRGACWTPMDISEPFVDESLLREQLLLLRDAGVNILRISGTFMYEQPAFYTLCDELGIMVWQDFMFARLPYPFNDTDFLAQVEFECKQIILRLAGHSCLVMFCGNTEVSQQAAMLGLQEPPYVSEFFQQTLPSWCHELAPGSEYCPSSPFGGVRAFSIGQGVAHYFGVGGYQRPLLDAELNAPAFASECLAFSHLPEARGLTEFLSGQAAYPTHPDFKAGVPRDVNAGWDFADISDFYLELLFKCDSRALRYQDPQRYFYLAKVATGEVSASVFQYWRQQGSQCQGGIIWLLRDLVKGAGWGIVDSEGYPKAAYYYLKRQWANPCLWFVDKGLEGLELHLAIEKNIDPHYQLDLWHYSNAGKVQQHVQQTLAGEFLTQSHWNVEFLLGAFIDITNAYRFGPAKTDYFYARLSNATRTICEAFYYPKDFGVVTQTPEPLLQCKAYIIDSTKVELEITSQHFARAVALNIYPFIPTDNYFDLPSNSSKRLFAHLPDSSKPSALRGTFTALNTKVIQPISIAQKE